MNQTIRHSRTRKVGVLTHHSRPGFTLIEVLAAITMLAIVMPAITIGISTALAAAEQSKRSIEAVTLGEAKLNELVVTGLWQNGAMSGDFQPDTPNYKWAAQVVTHDLNVSEIDLKVSWLARGQERSVNLATYVYLSSTTSSGGTSGTTSGGGTTR